MFDGNKHASTKMLFVISCARVAFTELSIIFLPFPTQHFTIIQPTCYPKKAFYVSFMSKMFKWIGRDSKESVLGIYEWKKIVEFAFRNKTTNDGVV